MRELTETSSETSTIDAMRLPLVCICIPTYNAAATIVETLKSILHQTYSNLVVHISDNASTDDTLRQIEAVADSRVIVHCHAENVGGEGNFNRCIQFSEGKYTAIFHADDVYEPDMLTKQVAFLETYPAAGAVFTAASTIDESGRITGRMLPPRDIGSKTELYGFKEIFKGVLRHSNFLICPSVLVRTQVYRDEIKRWRGEEFKSSADLDVWLRILEHHSVGYLSQPLMRYRISSSQFSALVRQRTERADFFLVIEHYLAQESVKTILTKEDMCNFSRLERRDKVMRAMNLLGENRVPEIQELLCDVWSIDALNAALVTKRGFFVLVLALYLWLLITLGLERGGRAPLNYLKRITGK